MRSLFTNNQASNRSKCQHENEASLAVHPQWVSWLLLHEKLLPVNFSAAMRNESMGWMRERSQVRCAKSLFLRFTRLPMWSPSGPMAPSLLEPVASFSTADPHATPVFFQVPPLANRLKESPLTALLGCLSVFTTRVLAVPSSFLCASSNCLHKLCYSLRELTVNSVLQLPPPFNGQSDGRKSW